MARQALRLIDGLNTVVYYAIGGLLAAITAVVLLQVIVRFVLTSLGINIAAPWTEEMARYLLVWLIFLGFVVTGVPRIAGVAIRMIALALCLVLFLLMIRYGMDFVTIIGRTELSPVMQISKTWVYWAMPAGGILMVVNTLAFVVENWLDGRDIRQSGGLADEA
jgi:TRAP-type C4-dicarboxylate transport system permease small subunit